MNYLEAFCGIIQEKTFVLASAVTLPGHEAGLAA